MPRFVSSREHKGYTIRRSIYSTQDTGETDLPKPLFEIPGLKSALAKPLLTTIADARRYINQSLRNPHLEDTPPGLPQRLRLARLRKGYSPEVLGLILGYPETQGRLAVLSWESGQERPPQLLNHALCRVLDITLQDLLM